jgi:hypothetical protein
MGSAMHSQWSLFYILLALFSGYVLSILSTLRPCVAMVFFGYVLTMVLPKNHKKKLCSQTGPKFLSLQFSFAACVSDILPFSVIY